MEVDIPTTTIKRPSERYYISTGEKSGFYTLRHSWMDTTAWGPVLKDYHIQNLSRDPDEAVAKAKKLTGQNLAAPDFGLDEIKRRKHEEVVEAAKQMPGGKYYGWQFEKLWAEDPDYVKWLGVNMVHSKDWTHTLEHFMSVPEIAEAITEERARVAQNIKDRNDRAATEKDERRQRAEALYFVKIALEKSGKLYGGRGDFVWSMWAKMQDGNNIDPNDPSGDKLVGMDAFTPRQWAVIVKIVTKSNPSLSDRLAEVADLATGGEA